MFYLKKYIYILSLEMASSGTMQHRVTLSFPDLTHFSVTLTPSVISDRRQEREVLR